MRFMMRSNRHIIAIIVLLFCTVVPSIWGQSIEDSLWEESTLYRDAWGVPHIYAKTPDALAFAFGYAQAEDHLEEMLLAYRMANGRMAEVLGEAYAESDAFSIKMGHAELARTALDTIAPVGRALCVGFAQGVNAWLAEHADQAPEWCEGVQPQDVLSLWHAFVMSMAPFDLPDTYHRPPAFDSGNAWALAPGRTESGKALLVINPHQYFDGPFRWYEAHLVWNALDMAGATLFGLPILLQGHNGVLGWALTPNEPDFADMFEERWEGSVRSPNDPRLQDLADHQQFLLQYMSHAKPYFVQTEGGLEQRAEPSWIGPRGPLFEEGGSTLYSWRIGGYHAFDGFAQLLAMGCAKNLATFQAALRMQQLPCFHVLYADREGNLFYLYNARTGTRRHPTHVALPDEPVDWRNPQRASDAGWAWETCFAAEELPYIVNPEAGYLQTCGTPPWTVTDDSALSPANWPQEIGREEDSFRARRVRRLLRSGTRSFRDMQSMLYDMAAPAALALKPMLLDMAAQHPTLVKHAHPDLNNALSLLRDWAGLAETDAGGMTFFHLWMAQLMAASGGELSSDIAVAHFLQQAPDAAPRALDAATDAARRMRNTYNEIDVPWGDVHRIRRGKRDEPAPGATTGEPIFMLSDHVYENGQWQATYGVGFAMAISFGEIPEAVSLSPFGTSEHPDSPHYDDQLDLLLARRMKRCRYQRSEVWRYADTARGNCITLYPLGIEGMCRITAKSPVEAHLPVSTTAPGALPKGLTAFTLFAHPQWTPKTASVELYLELYVPSTACKDENISQLHLYEWDATQVWRKVEPPVTKTEPRLFSVTTDHASVYAILGPVEYLEKPAEALPSLLHEQESAVPTALSPAAPRSESATDSETLFKLDRLDKESETTLPVRGMVFGPAVNEKGGATEATKPSDGTFALERLDTKDTETSVAAPTGFSTRIPVRGMVFGPKESNETTKEEMEGPRKFHIEKQPSPANATSPSEEDEKKPERKPVRLPEKGMAFGPDAAR